MAEPQVMLVTGAASGIGRQLATVLAGRGHRLIAADLDLPTLEARAAEAGWSADQVRRHRLDVRDPAAWTETVDLAIRTWGRLDVLLNVAGVLRPSSVHTVPAGDVDFHLDVNAKGVIHGTRGVAVSVVCPDAVATPMLDLQLGYPEAALTFSGGPALTVEDVARAIVDRVLTRKPIEVILPP